MCKMNPREAGLTPSHLSAGATTAVFAATSHVFTLLTPQCFPTSESSGKPALGLAVDPCCLPALYLPLLLSKSCLPRGPTQASSPGNPSQPPLLSLCFLGWGVSLQPDSSCHLTSPLRESCSFRFDGLAPIPQKPSRPGWHRVWTAPGSGVNVHEGG